MTTRRAPAWTLLQGPGQFGGCERPEHVELVSVRVGHDHPADVALADAHLAGAECFQPGDLGGLIAGPQIQMQPVLDYLLPGNSQEEQIRDNAVLRTALGRLQDNLVVRLEGAPPAERRLPERRDLRRITGVDTQALNAYIHTVTVASRGALSNGFAVRQPGSSTHLPRPRRAVSARSQLVRHTGHGDRWAVLGGAVEVGEPPADAAIREAREEIGARIGLRGLLGVPGGPDYEVTYPNGDRAAYVTAVCEAEIISGIPAAADGELSEIAWFPPADLAQIPLNRFSRALLTAVGRI